MSGERIALATRTMGLTDDSSGSAKKSGDGLPSPLNSESD